MSKSPEELLAQGFGREVRKRRDALGLSQEKLAVRADFTKETVRVIENGHIPRVALIYRLARALGTNLWELLPKDDSDLSTARSRSHKGGYSRSPAVITDLIAVSR